MVICDWHLWVFRNDAVASRRCFQLFLIWMQGKIKSIIPFISVSHGGVKDKRDGRWQWKNRLCGRAKRRCLIFPEGCPYSIVRAEELNDRVRDGNGCTLFAIITGSPAHTGGSLDMVYITTTITSCQHFFQPTYPIYRLPQELLQVSSRANEKCCPHPSKLHR